MKAFLLSLLVLLCFSCETNYKKAKPTDFLNKEAKTILRLNGLEQLNSNLNNSDFLNLLNDTKSYKSLSKHFGLFKHIPTKQPIYINLFSAEEFSFVTKFTNQLVKILDDKIIKRDSVTIDAIPAEKFTYNNTELYVTLRDSVIIGANTKEKLQSIYKLQPNEYLAKYLKTADSDSEIAVISNQTKQNRNHLFIDSLLNTKAFTNHLVFDADVTQDQILLNGISKATDSTKSLLNIFSNTTPNENELALVTPNNSDGFLSFTFNDFEVFSENLNAFNKKPTTEQNVSLFDNITEIGVIYNDANAIVLNSIDTQVTQKTLQEYSSVLNSYRNITIYKYNQPKLLESHFYPIINQTTKLYCQLDQFFVFSNSREALINIIASYQNKTTLFFKDYYKQNIKYLSSQSSLLQVINNKKLNQLINKGIRNRSKLDFKNYHSTAMQFNYDYDFAHFNAVLSKSKALRKPPVLSEKFNIKLDQDLLNAPQFVKNHITGKTEILVQDVKNTLYLISATGRILWKKTLKHPVLGTIEQIDILKNGKLQYAFATKKDIHIIDRNGNDVKPFPVSLKDDITQPLSVFDYDNNKEYRFLITQGSELLMLNSKGKTVTGFKYKKGNTITSQPKHFRIGSKDYVVFSAGKALKILSRTGSIRVKNSANVLTNNSFFLNDKQFTSYQNNGKLLKINQSGKSTNQSISTKNVTKFTSIGNTFAFIWENKLTIKNRTVELDFGDYTTPQLFYSNGKIFVSTIDQQTQKVYVFDSNANLLPNFPVFGNEHIDLSNLNNLEIITKGDKNSLIFYTIH